MDSLAQMLAPPDANDVSGDLSEVLAALIISDRQAEHWRFYTDQTWAHANLVGVEPRLQGWKLHVSATVISAERMLRACAAVLLHAGCSFKVAKNLRQVETLNSTLCPRGSAGKILTAYPQSDEIAVELARLLDIATKGFDGPRILSDMPLRAGSLVHYRYGVFAGTPSLTNDGEMVSALLAPNGEVVPDRREASFTPPSWASNPFAAAMPPTRTAGAVLLGKRFVVREAIRHANRGGVFRAVDQITGDAVVVKQARAHVATNRNAHDVRDRLRHEASVLEALCRTGWVPKPVEIFEQGGDLFLAEHDLGGKNLRSVVANRLADPRGIDNAVDVRQMLGQIATMLAGLHDSGVILRDFNPNNILLMDSGRVALVDLELAIFPTDEIDLCPLSGTPGYSAPEQFAGSPPDPSADLYSLGAIILFCLTGEDPLTGAAGIESIADWLDIGTRRSQCPSALAELATALSDLDPGRRPSAAAAASKLLRLNDSRPVVDFPDAAVGDLNCLESEVIDSAIEVLLERLMDDIDIDMSRKRIAEASTFGETTLPTNVQHGAAGLLGVLVQVYETLGGQEVLERIGDVARWLDRAVERQPAFGPVGLYFGYAGPCWALADAARVLGDRGMLQRAVERAVAIPADWPCPDVTHGVAGLGLTLVHLWEQTHDQRLNSQIELVLEQLVAGVGRDASGPSWRSPVGIRSVFAGKRFNGFAHGTAGIGLFLFQAANVTNDTRALDLAIEAAEGLIRLGDRRAGTVSWGSSVDDPLPALPHWCNGSAGVATFLSRLTPLGIDRLDITLDGAARSIMAAKWQSGIAYCHGLAGNADTLLDIASAVDGGYALWASDLARQLWVRRIADGRGFGFSDEPGRITPDFNVGYGGVLSMLLRLRHGGARLWLPAGGL